MNISGVDVPIFLTNDDRQAGQSIQSVTLYLTVIVSPNSLAENALHDANEAMTTINFSKTWEGALERIKWVTDTVSPVAEVRAMSILPFLDSRTSFSASPVCKDGIWSTFCDPQGDLFTLLSDGNTYAMFISLLDPPRTVST